MFPFGAKAIVHVPIEKRGKLDDRGRLCKLIDFQDDSRGHSFWDKEPEQVINSNHVKFIDFNTDNQSDKMKISDLVNRVELRLGKENTSKLCEEQDIMIDRIDKVHNMEIPTRIDKARHLNWGEWKSAIDRELNYFDNMKVWTPVEREENMKILKTKFIVDLKRRGSPEELVYRAHLVAQGFCQRYRIDCEHTYAPTASLTSLRLLTVSALKNKWKIMSFNVSVAYLHSPLRENVYVEETAEFRLQWDGKIMKLNKAMYGLKKAGNCWWLHFCLVMEHIGFKAEELDQCVYKCTRSNVIMYIWMHVDDGVIFSNSKDKMLKLKSDLILYLKLQWEDGISRVFGIEISYSAD
ncbi:hypothetical protein O181_060157 [Austropuccinia psidii MF-1]|uniref:Reverse transcriptase Ty1/copia-type domain-containing protein n=1 Tax=Austropuccinia psidii MF-1 TaxID=1389203 RepID=A0A9Q3EN15_9BASI|nr:hypothetical protein [Austropuccinia psidii MF-1]